jgi:pyridoxal phosphate enzyme (YggS family)
MSIQDNLQKIQYSLPQGVKLIAVSKTRTNEELLEAYNAGQRAFGENKVQELLRKQAELPEDIEWHLIGHLQTNKVKAVLPYVHLIHSVDSFKLLKIINREAVQLSKKENCLLQVHIAREETKFGFFREEILEMINADEFSELKNVNIKGLMGMATFTENQDQIRQEFRSLRSIFEELKDNYFKDNAELKELSMGMSDDYPIAIEEGSTMIRVGSKIFGPRT